MSSTIESPNGSFRIRVHNTARATWQQKINGKWKILKYLYGGKRSGTGPLVPLDGVEEDDDPPPPPPGPGLLTGQLTCDGRVFADDTGPVVPVMCHLGDLIWRALNGQVARVHAAFRDLVQYGYAGLRSWPTINTVGMHHDFWGDVTLGPQSTPNYHHRCEEVFRIGAEDYGLVWHVAPGDLFETSNREDDQLFDWLGGVARQHPTWFALIEGCNELLHNTDRRKHDPAYVDALLDRVRSRAPSVLATWSAAHGDSSEEHLPEWTPPWAKFWYVHPLRGPWRQAMEHNFTNGYDRGADVRRLGWNGEPPGMNWGNRQFVSGMPPRSTNGWPRGWTPGRHALYGVLTVLSRQIHCLMSSPGVKLEVSLTDVPGFKETPALIRKLPTDIHTFGRLFHGGERFKGERILAAATDSRVEHAIASDGRACMVAYGEDGTYQLPVERSWDGRAFYPNGQQHALSLRPGQPYRVIIGDGVLLVGALA